MKYLKLKSAYEIEIRESDDIELRGADDMKMGSGGIDVKVMI